MEEEFEIKPFTGFWSFLNGPANWYVHHKLDGLSLDEIRKRAYDGIVPVGYANLIPYLDNIASGREGERRIITGKLRDNLLAAYFQQPTTHSYEIPLENGKTVSSKDVNYLTESEYRPSMSKDNNEYFKLNNIHIIPEGTKKVATSNWKPRIIAHALNTIKLGQNKNTREGLGHLLGTYTLGRGIDPQRGEYVSYYDKWDLAPINKYGEDETGGIGKPIEIYDRIYLDDYYNVPTEPFEGAYYGGYLPEVTIVPKHRFGNKLIPKKRFIK